MLMGLQGAGKTTLAGKLANHFRKKGKKPLLVACDVYRPAAIKQLEVVGKSLSIPVYSREDTKDVLKIAKEAITKAKSSMNDLVILDTAGRLQIDEELMSELKKIKDNSNITKSFSEKLDIDGIIITKLDADTRGGAALSVKEITRKTN